MKRVPRGVHRMAVERCSGVFPLAHDSTIQRFDGHALRAEAGSPVWLTKRRNGGKLFLQRHSHLPWRRVLDKTLERPKTPASYDPRADSAEPAPAGEPAVCLQDVSQEVVHSFDS